MDKLQVYVGWDPREIKAHDVAVHSIKSRTSNADVHALKLSNIPELNRPVEWRGNLMWCPISDAPLGSEFSISRFAIPFLTKGWAVFMDSDMVCLNDIWNIMEYADEKYAAMVVKHVHVPTEEEKARVAQIDRMQTGYSRKNWASVILWNCNHEANRRLTWDMLNTLPGRDLHRFCWLADDEIGELPQSWNYLVDVNEPSDDINIAHYTLGGPWVKNWAPRESDRIWNEANEAMVNNPVEV